MNNALAYGHRVMVIRLTSGFGLYIESLRPSIRPALSRDPETGEECTLFIEYSATAIKLPFLTIEFGRFNEVPEDQIVLGNVLPGIFDDQDFDYEGEDDDETRT